MEHGKDTTISSMHQERGWALLLEALWLTRWDGGGELPFFNLL